MEGTEVDIPDTVEKRNQLSVVSKFGDLVILDTDDAIRKDLTNVIQVLKPNGDDGYTKNGEVLLFEEYKGDGKEMDIEGIAVDGDTVYVIGSHSAKRPRVKSHEN